MEPTDDTGDEIPDGDETLDEISGVTLSPADHQRVKDLVHGEQMQRLRRHDRSYLVAGAGGDTGAATRRQTVSDLLDDRPDATAIRLEDFGLTPEEIELWVRVFDILCGRVTHIVGVIEDFDARGYVWELGLLFAPDYREKVWLLKRRYPDDDVERERFDNGMAASHVELLVTGDRCTEWATAADVDDLPDVPRLPDAVSEIP
jgi:hypothetical protein